MAGFHGCIVFLFATATLMIVLCPVHCTSLLADSTLSNWRKLLPDVSLPKLLLSQVSPFTAANVGQFLRIISDGNLSNHAAEFCTVGELVCKQSVPITHPSDLVGENVPDKVPENVFFRENRLLGGTKLTLPEFHSGIERNKFLPKAVADKFSISTSTLPKLLEDLQIPSSSNMSYNMYSAVKLCEKPIIHLEGKECVTSFEAMTSFVVSALGTRTLDVLSNPTAENSNELVEVTNVRKLDNGTKPPVSCHGYSFPFAIYDCHYIAGTIMYEVSLKTVKNKMVKRFAVCHNLHKDQCHWVFSHDLMWVLKRPDHRT